MLIEHQNPHGGDIYSYPIEYDFSANISPLGTPSGVRNAIVEASVNISSYPDPYCRQLRKSLADFHHISIDSIICGNGAADIIYSFAAAVKPRHALIVTPTFCEYEDALNSVGCVVTHFQLSKEENFFLSSDFTSAITTDIDVVILCNPNNPTGVLYPKTQLVEVAKKCMENNTLLFIDECFFDLTGAPTSDSMVDVTLLYPNVFILKAFTKSYGMAGVRLGYAISSNRKLLLKICNSTQVWNVSTIAQQAGIAALNCTEHLLQSIEIINTERHFLIKELTNLGIKVYPSKVNFLLFQCSDTQLFPKLLKKKIMIRRCSNFAGLDESFYRCAVKSHTENIALISALKEVLHNG